MQEAHCPLKKPVSKDGPVTSKKHRAQIWVFDAILGRKNLGFPEGMIDSRTRAR